MEDNYWKLSSEKKQNFIKMVVSKKKEISLSSNVWIYDNIVIKKNDEDDYLKEKIFKIFNYKYEFQDDFIIRNYIDGKVIDKVDLNQVDIIRQLMEKLSLLNNIGQVKERDNLLKKIIKKEEYISNFLYLNKLLKIDISKMKKELVTLVSDRVCHGDLNDGNILIDKSGELHLIDFDEITFSDKYHDISILISNWEIDYINILIFCDRYNLDIVFLIKQSIIWSILFIDWNEKKFKSTSNPIYLEKINKLLNNLFSNYKYLI